MKMEWDILIGIFPTVVVDGVVLGFVYALIALGYTMVYGVLQMINFAHSEIFVTGAFVGAEVLLILQTKGVLTSFHPLVLLVIIIGAAMLVSGLLAVTVERVAYRPLRNAPGPADFGDRRVVFPAGRDPVV